MSNKDKKARIKNDIAASEKPDVRRAAIDLPEQPIEASDDYQQILLLEPSDNIRIANLTGPLDQHLRQIESTLNIATENRGNRFVIKGRHDAVIHAAQLLQQLYDDTAEQTIDSEHIHLALRELPEAQSADHSDIGDDEINDEIKSELALRTRRGMIRVRNAHQGEYVRHMLRNDISFGVGPAGTGKTYLAVAAAVQALEKDEVRRLVLVRPAVEAGERLGFLPGDLVQKIDPYLRPLFDALYEMLGFDRVAKLQEKNVIEVAPLAFMRGRTLNESFILLDEAQNTTIEQMKMFLTRIGFGSRAVITGDPSQTDLPRQTRSGLGHALSVLADVEGVSITKFEAKDVVRHNLVQKIVMAYEKREKQEKLADSEARASNSTSADNTQKPS